MLRNPHTTAIALPIFTGDYLTGVLVFLCGEAPECVGAIEIWHCDTQESHDLTLFDGYFGCLDRFRAIAERTSLRPGTGLPGLVWQSGMPVLMRDLGRTHAFIRYEGALEAGITMGLGFPVFHDPTQVFLVTLLFARGTPFARRIEVWVVDEKRESLTFLNGYSDRGVDLARQYANIHVRIAEGPLGRVLLTGVPAVCGLEFPWISAREDGLKHLVCIPVIEAGRCKAIVVLFS